MFKKHIRKHILYEQKIEIFDKYYKTHIYLNQHLYEHTWKIHITKHVLYTTKGCTFIYNNIYFSANLTLYPMPSKNSGTDFCPSDICLHNVFSCCCSCLVSLRTRFLVGSPILALSSSVSTFVWSFWMH